MAINKVVVNKMSGNGSCSGGGNLSMGGGPPTGETAEELAGEPPAIEEGGGETRGGMAVEPPQKDEATSEVDVAPSGRFGRRGGDGGGYTHEPNHSH